MNISRIDDSFSRSSQILPADVAAIKDAGFTTILCARPDNEDPGQPDFAEIKSEADRLGIAIVHIPVSGQPSPVAIADFTAALRDAPGPVIGYCRSGARAEGLYRASRVL